MMNSLRAAFLIFTIAFSLNAWSQPDLCPQKQLQLYEDSLKTLGDSMVNGREEYTRKKANEQFIPMLVRALKTSGSYTYPFQKLKTVSILSPGDKSFRIFTWQLLKDDGTYRYYGGVQVEDKKELKLYPLFDNSLFMESPEDTVGGAKNWYGALYYNIEQNRKWFKKYYTLFGWDGNDRESTKKVIDILSFEKGEPVFGAPLFKFKEGNKKSKNGINRYIIEFNKRAAVTLNYDEELKMIIYDHLIPPNPAAEGYYRTYIPDGTYEGFKWKGGKWYYVEKVFHQTFDEPPVPKPVKERSLQPSK